jgi:transcriptional regulator with XRE-family HTH domain
MGTTAFGILLHERRRAAGLSQRALAERAGLSVDAVAALERGRRAAPRQDTVAQLAAHWLWPRRNLGDSSSDATVSKRRCARQSLARLVDVVRLS